MKKKVYSFCIDGIMDDTDYETKADATKALEDVINSGDYNEGDIYSYDYSTQDYTYVSHIEKEL